ncbi:MAG: hypothetical protein HRU03_02670 [Nanoarchaeales archaeon]|nr:hypothetical protein [Nanoarchaeales archaeon]
MNKYLKISLTLAIIILTFSILEVIYTNESRNISELEGNVILIKDKYCKGEIDYYLTIKINNRTNDILIKNIQNIKELENRTIKVKGELLFPSCESICVICATNIEVDKYKIIK